ncbi:uncharacterized protein M6B38_387545 [Iris pallida]|uniref:Uncharacterized protein n=1 Tax=Iris pallida TaxID=29817 RepID=A0AAX6G265_IRIPA|nr:uncharacterized protein M6B38_387545 [Iris pallida]
MVANLRMQNSSNFMTHTIICMNSLALGLHNKMELWIVRTELYLKWLELC